MKRINQCLLMAGMAAFLSLGASNLSAQERGGDRGRGNFDPAQFRERMMERYKEQLEIKDDAEWKALQPLVQKVLDTRRQTMGDLGRMFGRGPRPGGDDNNSGGDRGRDRGRGAFGQEPNPDADALQKAIDSKASNSELKNALAKYQESRKAKQAELEKAQADLRKVLSVRQEAIASMNGLL
jgi:hypothetical protein